MTLLACPTCRTPLAPEHGPCRCERCGTEYPARNGIVCFNETGHYYGELRREEMQEMLRLAEEAGWRPAVEGYLLDRNPGLVKTIMDPRRTTWTTLLGLSGDETALDYGCGLGGVSVPLSKQVGKVVALDGCFDRIRFLQIRRDQERLANISLVCNGDTRRLPFGDGAFDLVVLNMVFPYLAATLPDLGVPEAEALILGEIVRVIKPGGALYLSIRNRYCAHRARTLLWRPASAPPPDNFEAHGYGYYRKLLSGAGIADARAFWPIPSYKYADHYVPLDGPASATARGLDLVESFSPGKKMLARALKAVGSLTFLTETIAFVGRKDGGSAHGRPVERR